MYSVDSYTFYASTTSTHTHTKSGIEWNMKDKKWGENTSNELQWICVQSEIYEEKMIYIQIASFFMLYHLGVLVLLDLAFVAAYFNASFLFQPPVFFSNSNRFFNHSDLFENLLLKICLAKRTKKVPDFFNTVAVFAIAHKNLNYNNNNNDNNRMNYKNIYKALLNVITLVKYDAHEMNLMKSIVFVFEIPQ